MTHRKLIVMLALFCLLSGTARAQEEDFAEMTLEQLMQVPIEVATGIAKPISEAPAVVSVITAEEIEAMGALHTEDILATVPGLHIAYEEGRNLGAIYTIRGMRSATTVLVLVNGIAINRSTDGGWGTPVRIPVQAIERVEVIRGPGSAVYGADAFAGLVNIVTKDAKDINGTEIGLRGGSFETQNAWFQHGGTAGDWEYSLSFEWQQTDGDEERILGSDLQSILDGILGTNASYAPAPVDTRYDVTNANLELSHGKWSFHLWQVTSNDHGAGAGSGSLDPDAWVDSEMLTTDLTYSNDEIANGWSLTSRIRYHYSDFKAYFHLLTPNAVAPIAADGNLALGPPPVGVVFFPDGVIGSPGNEDTVFAFDTYAVSTGLENHRFRLGVGIDRAESETSERKNYGPGVLDIATVGLPLPPVVGADFVSSLTGTPYVYLPDNSRNHWYVSLQDEWSLSNNWEATLGVRYDDYSGFGETVNPRLALVWSGTNVVTKLLYGSAFRAPSFLEQTLQNNPIAVGNLDLKPEEEETFELAIDYRMTDSMRAVVNFFQYDVDGWITNVMPEEGGIPVFMNSGDIRGRGLEFEMFLDPTSNLRLRANYSLQRSEDKHSGEDLANSPEQMFFLSALWRPLENWTIYAKGKWIDDQARSAGDPRPPIDSYTIADLTLRRNSIANHLDIGVSVRNLFDEEAFEPISMTYGFGLPLESRSYIFELRYAF